MKKQTLQKEKIIEHKEKIKQLNYYIEDCFEEQMRIQDIYLEGEEFNLGKYMNFWERKKEKARKEQKTLTRKIAKLQKHPSNIAPDN